MKKFINVRLKGRKEKVELLVDDGIIVANPRKTTKNDILDLYN
ncbi:MAG: hypothetical protein U0K68_03030 [Agathobacter sp.]|nr:hypothetical protein [Agathobacter sp.]